MTNTQITLKDIYYDKLNNPYCDICNNRLNWALFCNRGFDFIQRFKGASNLEHWYCFDCKFSYIKSFMCSNGNKMYALKFCYNGEGEIIIVNDLDGIFISREILDRSVIEKNTNVAVKLLIKYPHLNKETIKYFNNLIFT